MCSVVLNTQLTDTFVVQKNNTKVNSFQDISKRIQCIYQYVGNIILMYSIYTQTHITTPTFKMLNKHIYIHTQSHSQECSPIREHSQ